MRRMRGPPARKRNFFFRKGFIVLFLVSCGIDDCPEITFVYLILERTRYVKEFDKKGKIEVLLNLMELRQICVDRELISGQSAAISK